MDNPLKKSKSVDPTVRRLEVRVTDSLSRLIMAASVSGGLDWYQDKKEEVRSALHLELDKILDKMGYK